MNCFRKEILQAFSFFSSGSFGPSEQQVWKFYGCFQTPIFP
jgi:hypothetical protein